MARPKQGETTKADVIRQGLKDHPDLGPTDLAVKLNEKVKKEGLGLAEIKPSEISVYRSKERQEAGAAATRRTPTTSTATKPTGKPAPAVGHASVAEVLRTARTLVDQLGKEEAKKVIDLL